MKWVRLCCKQRRNTRRPAQTDNQTLQNTVTPPRRGRDGQDARKIDYTAQVFALSMKVTSWPGGLAPCLEKTNWMVTFSALREINPAELGLTTHGP